MKNLYFLLTLSIVFASCTKNDPDTGLIDNSTPILSSYTYETHNATTGDVLTSTVYNLDNNKILGYTSANASALFSYENDKISEILSYTNGALVGKRNFEYNSNGKLSEFLVESINSSLFNKHSFTHTQDTIFSEWKRSTDGIHFDLIATFKIVLDVYQNRTYLEEHDIINNEVKIVYNTYDTNHNMITYDSYRKNNDNSLSSLFSSTYTYDTSINLLSVINENTYKKETFSLLYHLQTSAINNFTPRNISYNAMQSMSNNFGNQFTYTVQNEVNDNNYAYFNTFKVYNNGVLFTKFTLEFTE
ncbi:hypothetical protein [Pseudotenacibaculum haliotis]|uniref:YD repeat-containing protein n=1 Tax=Pseudotenacibaculum haliotis TaxID=1862138 RepID=A0ABW5LUJ2_9FLAO